MGEATRPQFGSYAEGSSAVVLAYRAATGGDEFHLRSEAGERVKRRLRPRTVQGYDLIRRRNDGACRSIEGCRLLAPDRRHDVPAFVVPRCPRGAFGGGEIQVLRRRHYGLRRRRGLEPRDAVRGRRHAFGKCKPATPLGGPVPHVDVVVTLGFKDADRLLRQEHASAVDPSDYDATPTTRAQAATFRCRIQEHRTVRAGRYLAPRRRRSLIRLARRDGRRIDPRALVDHRLDFRWRVLLIAPEQAPKEVDLDLPKVPLASGFAPPPRPRIAWVKDSDGVRMAT